MWPARDRSHSMHAIVKGLAGAHVPMTRCEAPGYPGAITGIVPLEVEEAVFALEGVLRCGAMFGLSMTQLV